MHALVPCRVADGLHAELDRLLKVDPTDLDDRELLETVSSLEELESRLAAGKARFVAAAEARGAYEQDGAQSMTQWIAGTCKLPRGTASRDVRLARSLRRLPELAAALADGDIGIDKVRAVVRLHAGTRTREAIERDDEVLTTAARHLDWLGFQQALAYWVLVNDPDGSSEDAERRRARRRFSMVQLPDGSWHVEGLLDPIAGTKVDTALRRIADDLYRADRDEARERLGRDPLPGDLTRSPEQRRADALVEMAERAMATPPDARRPAPLVTVVVDLSTFGTLVSELLDGVVVDPSDIGLLLDDALIERIVFDGPDRVMTVGRQRLFRDALRRAIEVRDRRCAHPLCDAPVWRCHVDHKTRYREGGLTSQDNGRLYCGFHNYLRERQGGREPPSLN